MKIKDIVKALNTANERMYTAYRIYNTTPDVRAAIREYKEMEEMPLLKVRVKTPTGQYADITSKELTTLYGFKPLSALLMIGDIKKAQASGNVRRLDFLLSFLVNGRHVIDPKTCKSVEKIKERMKVNNPAAWAEYQKLCDSEAEKAHQLEKDYQQMMEAEL